VKNLVIVESPTKANTIERYLGSDFKVLSSKGHVRDLPEKELGVNLEDDFEPTLVVQNEKLVGELRGQAKESSQVLLATDNDREGEAIAFDLYQLLKRNGRDGVDSEDFSRIIFNEITEGAIKEAIGQPTSIDMNKVNAQRARRILDRLVGYLISPLLSKSVSGSRFEGLSAGRVQSVALRFIVDREEEREEFEPEEYWEIEVDLREKGKEFSLDLVKIDGSKPEIGKEEKVKEIEEKLESLPFLVSGLKRKKKTRSPLPPFITSTLQRTASSVLNFSPSKTMRIAQQLYEGIQLAEGTEGLITYMRTDSTRVAEKAQDSLRDYIKESFGDKYLVSEARKFRKGKGAQDAHEAIRPTDVKREPKKIKKYLDEDQLKLYRLVWQRFVATQMEEARYLRTRVEVEADGFVFRTSASRLEFDGFLKVLPLKPLGDQDVELPEDLEEGQQLQLAKFNPSQHFTKPPNRFSEASLIKKLEKGGIGRPSTYASIISTIRSRDYVYKSGGSFVPTLLGFIVVKFLKEFFPQTVQPTLTAEMENSLDLVKNGERSKEEVLQEFYRPLKDKLDRLEDRLESEDNAFEVPTDVECERCGGHMNIRYWKGSPYLSCSSWPECEEKKSLPPGLDFTFKESRVLISEELENHRQKEERLGKMKCPQCGSEMEIKHGRYGRFYACTNEDCDNTESVSTGVSCPRCGEGELLERYSRKRKQTFYGCSEYPDCKFTTNKEPVKVCPDCEEGVLVRDREEEELVCSNKNCDYREAD